MILKIDSDDILLVTVEPHAYAVQHPIKSKKASIVTLPIMLGLMLGVCVAFIHNAVCRRAKD